MGTQTTHFRNPLWAVHPMRVHMANILRRPRSGPAIRSAGKCLGDAAMERRHGRKTNYTGPERRFGRTGGPRAQD